MPKENLENRDEKTLENCYFVKTILMISVVIAHCCLFWGGDWFTSVPVVEVLVVLPHFGKWLNSFNIFCFALVSGYIFYFIKMEKGGYRDFRSFILGKVKRLIIPYFVVTIVWCIPIALVFGKYDFKHFVLYYLLGTGGEQLWFLLMLFWVFLFFYFIANYVDKNPLRGGVIVLLFYLLGFVAGYYIPDFYRIWTGFTYMPFFYLGFIIRKYGIKLLEKIPIAIYLIADIALYALSCYLGKYKQSGLIFRLLNVGCLFVLHIVGAVSAFIVLSKIARIVKWKKNKIILFISDRSMAIYLFHQQIIYFVIYFLNGKVSPYVNAVLNFLIAFSLSLVISSVLLVWNKTRCLIGEKPIKHVAPNSSSCGQAEDR